MSIDEIPAGFFRVGEDVERPLRLSLEAAGAADVSASGISFSSNSLCCDVWAVVLSWSPQPASDFALASRRPRVGASVGASLCASDS